MSHRNPSRRRRRIRSHRKAALGMPPGSLIADPEAPRSIVQLIAYGPDGLVEIPVLTDLSLIATHLARWPVTWVNVDGLGDVAAITRLGELFGLHRLALEDVLNVHQRAKVEEYGQHYFIVTRELESAEAGDSDQLCLFLGRNFVVTFQQRPGDCFNQVRERIRKGGARVRECGPDYLAYALLDAVIDGYFPPLEQIGEQLESLEDELIAAPRARLVARVHELRRDLLLLRRHVWPQREALNALIRDSSPLISAETRIYLRDCYDHNVRIMDLVDSYRELCADLVDLYLSSASHRMNEIIKVLTIVSTIFMPLSFIAGVYGMNFDRAASGWNMPELGWRLGYPFALGLMGGVAGVMMLSFWRRGWLGAGRGPHWRRGEGADPPR